MEQTEFDILEYLASQKGKSAATIYDESGGKAFTEISNELTGGKGFNIIRDVNGHAIGAINNSTGELLGNLSSGTTYGTAAETTANGYNLVTTATTTAGETAGTITTELASGANEAATSAAGKAGVALSGITLKSAIFSGMAALGGVAQGVKWYNENPEFWTHLSKALLPFAYGGSYKNSGNELSDTMNALIPTAVSADGKTYLSSDFMNTLAQELVNINLYQSPLNNITLDTSNSAYKSISSYVNLSKSKYYSYDVKNEVIFDNIYYSSGTIYKVSNFIGNGPIYAYSYITYDNLYMTRFISESSFSCDSKEYDANGTLISTKTGIIKSTTFNSKKIYYIDSYGNSFFRQTIPTFKPCVIYDKDSEEVYDDKYWYTTMYILLYGTKTIEFPVVIDNIKPQNNAEYPQKDKDLSETYPEWFENVLKTLNPESTPNNPSYNYWYPVSIQNEPDSDGQTKGANTTYSQADAQTGNNPDSTTAPDAMTAAQEKIAEAIKELTKTLTKQGTDTKIPPDTPTDTGETPTHTPPIISGSSNGLWAIYNPSENELQSFGKWLWSSDIIDQIVKMISNPMDAIIGLHTIYVTPPTSGTATIKAGYLDSGVSAAKVSNQYTSIDCGTVTIPEKYQNALDYDYTRVSIYLPFIGIVPLNTRDVMGASLHLTYRVDVLTGTCLAQIRVTKQNSNAVLYTYSGNCAVQIPLTSGNYGTLLTGLLSAVGGVVASVASGGAALPAVAGIGSAALNSHTNVSQSGNLGSNAGALGIRKPYVIITRPTPYNAENYPSFYGIPSQKYVMLGNVSGFTKVREIHVENINATNEEKSEIEGLLKGGVLL